MVLALVLLAVVSAVAVALVVWADRREQGHTSGNRADSNTERIARPFMSRRPGSDAGVRVWLVLRDGPAPPSEPWYVNQVLDGLTLDGLAVRHWLAGRSIGSFLSHASFDEIVAVASLHHYADLKGVDIDRVSDEIGYVPFADGDGCKGWFVYARRRARR